MKKRPYDFLSEQKIDHDSEIFDYIVELHKYLWIFVRQIAPSICGGNLEGCIDFTLEKLGEKQYQEE